MAEYSEELQNYTTEELIDEIVERGECNQIGELLEITECKFSTSELAEALRDEGYDVSMEDLDDVEDIDDNELIGELENRGYFVFNGCMDFADVVRQDFERSPTAALEVLQDLLGMQHTTTKEQVIEQLKQIL